jgi:hypothetical protein
VFPLVVLLGDGLCDPAFAQIGAEYAGAVGLISDDVVRPAARAADGGAGHSDAFQQRFCTAAVMALTQSEKDDQRSATAVADEVELGDQASSGPAEGVIARFVPPVLPPFRPVAAACWWARTMVESICTSQSMSLAASAWAWTYCKARVNTPPRA